MNKTKIIPVVLLVVILGIGFVAFTFYSENQNLENTNVKLKNDNEALINDFNALKYRYTNLEKAKTDTERKLSLIKNELSRLEDEKSGLRRELLTLSEERDRLIEKVKRTPRIEVQPAVGQQSEPGEFSDQYWADFVKKKAAMEVKLEALNTTLFDEKNRIAVLRKENKELSLKIDQLAKDKQRLREELKFKERTLRIVSMDLVGEKEGRGAAVNELKRLRNENMTLKRELILANKEQIKLQSNFKDALEKKNALEMKIKDAESILKEKFLIFKELQTQLETTIQAGKKITAGESASVELPPIVVKPNALALKGLQGEVIAVNSEEEFIVVDIGEAAGLRPGALLKIIRGDTEVATVEVIETRREISAANIKEILGGATVQEGDKVVSK